MFSEYRLGAHVACAPPILPCRPDSALRARQHPCASMHFPGRGSQHVSRVSPSRERSLGSLHRLTFFFSCRAIKPKCRPDKLLAFHQVFRSASHGLDWSSVVTRHVRWAKKKAYVLFAQVLVA